MDDTSENKPVKQICAALLAHVDAGKTTLSEALLYTAGCIRKAGRVDRKDTFFDTDAMERARGITIFSKQASLSYGGCRITLLDTPGHVDFSAEMERTLQVLDYAILVISGADGVQGHTVTLWRLLEEYKIPAFLFVNKMDQPGTDKETLLLGLKKAFGEGCVDFTDQGNGDFYENIALTDEGLLERYLETGKLSKEEIGKGIAKRNVFPCFFGSALKLSGVEELLCGLDDYTLPYLGEGQAGNGQFGARIFKITREQGMRLTHMKVTGGTLRVKDVLSGPGWEEKVNQIRIYSGEKFQAVGEAKAGTVCAVTGLTKTKPGEGLGTEGGGVCPRIAPVLTYRILLPKGCDAGQMLPKLRQLEEEDPQLHLVWKEALAEIQVQMMGEIQIEILKNVILERFGVEVDFDEGNIVYRETIADKVEGVGHYEPLRHYAEVHLIMEPLPAGSGLVFDSQCSEDALDRNWQRLILTHLMEKEHRGVLTGAAITDMKITLAAGKAHLKHTEGGDFRQATYRAVRQGLKKAKSVLLEPWYEFSIELPELLVGRAMADVERMQGSFFMDDARDGGEGMVTLKGEAPVAAMRGYPKEVQAYTKGRGRIFTALKGYAPCHNEKEVAERCGYDPEGDLDNPSGSVFCAHGAGFVVPWDKVEEYMHLPSALKEQKEDVREEKAVFRRDGQEPWIGEDEVEAIFHKTFYSNQSKDRKKKPYSKSNTGKGRIPAMESSMPKRHIPAAKEVTDYSGKMAKAPSASSGKKEKKEEYLLVDGYNIIFAWEELNALAKANIDSARDKLVDILCNYQAIRQCSVIVVFDAYRVKGHGTEFLDYHNIHLVYTKEAETADSYIEKFAHENGRKYDVTVATSDRLEQMIIIGQGCRLFSAGDFKEEVEYAEKMLREDYEAHRDKEGLSKNRVEDALSPETKKLLSKLS